MKTQEKLFLFLVKRGKFSVSKNGSIKNRKQETLGSISRGYVLIHFSYKGESYTVLAHRIVYLFFSKKDIPEGYQINHKDSVRNNNNYKNLECITASENIQHAIKNNRFPSCKGELNPLALFKDRDVIKYRKLHAEGKLDRKTLIEKYSSNRTTIYDMLSGKTYKHLPLFDNPAASAKANANTKHNEAVLKLKSLANQKGMTRYKAAKILEVSAQTVRAWCEKYDINLGIKNTRHLTDSEVEYCRKAFLAKKRTRAELAIEFDIAMSAMYKILAGESYKTKQIVKQKLTTLDLIKRKYLVKNKTTD